MSKSNSQSTFSRVIAVIGVVATVAGCVASWMVVPEVRGCRAPSYPPATPQPTPVPSTPTATSTPSHTPTLSPTPTPTPTATSPAAGATPSVLVPGSACSPGMACLEVVNHLGSRLTFSVDAEGISREVAIQATSLRVLQLPPGQYNYTASAFGGCDWFEMSHSGAVTLEVGRVRQLAFTVVCDYWREDDCCVGPRIETLP
jgi:hypothetical protein